MPTPKPHPNVGRPRREWRPEAPIAFYKPIRAAAKIFFEDGAAAALTYLGVKKELLGAVFMRAKYLERCAKRLAAEEMQLAMRLRALQIQIQIQNAVPA